MSLLFARFSHLSVEQDKKTEAPTSAEATATMSKSQHATFLREALKRAPFLVLSKTAPSTLPEYDVNKDFKYFFYSDCMASWACLPGTVLRRGRGGRNAKNDYPNDYKHIFEDDAEVMVDFSFPAVKDYVERWSRPGIQTIAHCYKTGVIIENRPYMLGCLTIVDDVELGITTFRTGYLPPEMPEQTDIPTTWYGKAFEELPLPMAIVDYTTGEIITANALMRDYSSSHSNGGATALFDKTIKSCLVKVREIRKTDKGKETWEFSRVEGSDGHRKFRAWVWKPVPERDSLGVCFSEQHPSVATLPDMVRQTLGE